MKTILLGLLTLLLGFTFAQSPSDILAEVEEPVRIVYWRSLAGPRGEAQEELVRRFNEMQDDVEVDVQFQGSYGELSQKLLAALAARDLPNVVMLCDTCMPDFAREGVLEPLDPFVDGPDGVERNTFVGKILDGGKVNEALYLIPFAASTPLLYYNPDIFEQVGLDGPPQTWDEFFEYARTIHEATGGQVAGVTLSTPFDTWWFQAQIWSQGGEFSNSDFETFVDSEVWIEEMTKWRDLVASNAARLPSSAEGGNLGDFANGFAAMNLFSTANLTSIFEEANGFTPATAFLPEGEAGRVVPTGGSGLAILAGQTPQETAASWIFINYMTSPEFNAYYAEQTGYMPYTQGAIAAMQDFLAENPQYQTSIDQLQYARNQSELNGVRDANTELRSYLDRIVLAGEDPAVVLPEAQAAVQASFESLGLR